MFSMPPYRPRRPAPRLPAPAPVHPAHAWRRVERAMVWLVDRTVCPVSLPLHLEQGRSTLRSGRPARRFVAQGLVANGKQVACLVAPDDRTGEPRILWADGAPITSFRLQGV